MTTYADYWWYRNSRPTGADVSRTINEDSAYVVRRADFGFQDVDRGQTLSAVRIDTLPARGSLLLAGVPVTAGQVIQVADIDAGKLSFAPAANQSGNAYASFTFSVRDSAGSFDACPNTFKFNVCPVNDAPIANVDTATTAAGTAVTINVKANDTDPDNTPAELKVTQAVVLDPSKGSVTINADGTLTFRPAAGVSGPVELQYTLKDPAGLSDTAKVTVNVTPPGPDTKQCVTFDFSGNTALDGPDGNVRTYSASGLSVHVSAFAREKGANGAWSTAWLGAYGGGLGVTDSQEGNGGNNGHTVDNICRDNFLMFEFNQQVVLDKAYLGYVVCDSDIKVWIGTIPDAFDRHTVLSDQVLAGLGFTEVNQTTLTSARWADLNANGIAGNVIIIAADTTDLTPEDQFKLEKLAVCTVPVVDNAPEGADVTRTTDEDTSYVVRVADFGFRDADVGQTFASVRIDTLPGNGRLLLDGVAVTTGQVILTSAIDAGQLRFAPDDNENGSPYASFTFSVRDSSGRFDAAPNTFTLNVTPVNDGPVARPDTGSTTEDDTLTVSAANGVILSGGNADGRDTDLDGDTLTVSAVAFGGTAGTVGSPVQGQHGELRLNGDGSYTYAPAASTQGLDDGESVQDVFEYTVSDGQGGTARSTLTITVRGLNDAPIAVPDSVSTPEEVPAQGNVLANDRDPDDEPLAVASFRVAGDDTVYQPGQTASIADVGTLLIQADGSFVFTPAPNFNGAVPLVTYAATDGTAQSEATLTITVTPANDGPVARPDVNATDEDSVLTVVAANGVILSGASAAGRDSDVDGDALSVLTFGVGDAQVAAGSTVQGQHGTLLLRADGSYVYTPFASLQSLDTGESVRDVFTYVVGDGQEGTDRTTLTIDVAGVNDGPLALNDAFVVREDGELNGNVLDNDSDPDGEPLTVTSYSVAGITTPFAAGATAVVDGVGSLVLRADGSFTFVPAPNYFGPVPVVTYVASDGDATASAELRIDVQPVNDPPVGVNDTARTDQGVPVTGNVLANDTDPENDTLRVTGFTVTDFPQDFLPGVPALLAGIGQLVIEADGRYTFTPAAGFRGTVPTVTYVLSDGTDTATANLDIVVNAVNQPPVLAAGPAAVLSEEGLAFGLPDTTGTPEDTTDAVTLQGQVSVSDPDGDALTVTLSAPTAPLSSGGTALQWAGSGTGVLVGSAGGTEVLRIAIDNAGRYTVEVKAPLDHPVIDAEDVLQFGVGVSVSDGQATATAELQVRVEDDAPVAATIRQTAQRGPAETNLMFVLDLSGSMQLGSEVFVDDPNNPGTQIELTRLELEVRAIDNLIGQYEGFGNVRVRIVTFSDDAQSVGTEWVDGATARAQLATLSTGNWTNYDAALTQAVDAFDDPGRLAGAKNALYFLSDGDPTAADTGSVGDPTTNPDIGIQPAEEAAWRSFLTGESITAFAVGLGNSSLNQTSLDPVAFNGRTGAELDGILVTDLSNLDPQLLTTVTQVVSGKLALGDVASFGADGGRVASVSVDGTTYAFDAANGGSVTASGTDRSTFNTLDNTLSVQTLNNGRLVIDLDDGTYRYATDSTGTFVETVQFTLADNDGDTAASNLQIRVEGGVAPNLAPLAAPLVASEAPSLDLRDVLADGASVDGWLGAASPATTGAATAAGSDTAAWAEAAAATASITTALANETALRARWEG